MSPSLMGLWPSCASVSLYSPFLVDGIRSLLTFFFFFPTGSLELSMSLRHGLASLLLLTLRCWVTCTPGREPRPHVGPELLNTPAPTSLVLRATGTHYNHFRHQAWVPQGMEGRGDVEGQGAPRTRGT